MNGAGGFLLTRLFSEEITERGDADAFAIAAAMDPASWDPRNSFQSQSTFAHKGCRAWMVGAIKRWREESDIEPLSYLNRVRAELGSIGTTCPLR